MQTPSEAAQFAAIRFRNSDYIRHNARRLEHLASLALPIHGATVLEVGAGIGDHSTFYLDRGCTVTALEPRPENCEVFRMHMETMARYEEQSSRLELVLGDVELLDVYVPQSFEIVHCYGLLYHVGDPESVLAAIAAKTTRLLILETCVSFGSDDYLYPGSEATSDPTQSFHGRACRPTRVWVFNQLKRLFPHAYVPRTQPAHEEFPLDWDPSKARDDFQPRAVFVASREALSNPLLLEALPERQLPA